MPYRADIEALEARAAVLERELADARRRAQEAATLKETERDLERELAETRRRLAAASAASSRSGSVLDDVKIASPCHARWEDMIGDERVRFCSKCQKDVFNLSAMTRTDAEALLLEKAGSMCARLYRRTDGTVITADCPVGVRAKRVRRLALVVGGGMMAGAAASTMLAATKMGEVAPCDARGHGHAQVEMGGPRAQPAPPPTSAEQGDIAPHQPTMMGSVAPMAPPPPPAHMGKVVAHPPAPR